MTNKNLQEIMREQWQEVRKRFYYPQLPQPQLTTEVPNGQFNFDNLQIKINPDYLEQLVEKGCKEVTSLNAILGHETGHFVYYPGSVLDLLRLHKIARVDLDEQQAYGARESFLNVQNNTNLVQNMDYSTIPETLKAGPSKEQGLNKIILGLYQELWKKDLRIKLKRKEKALVKKLQELNYLDKNTQEQTFRKFIDIVKEYLQKPEDYQTEDHSSGSGFSENQIREGIRQFAKETQPGEFEKISEEVLKEFEKGKEETTEQKTRALGAGTEKGNLIIARNFYSALAENFSIPIRKKQMQKNGTLYPHSHEEFSLDDKIDDLDAFSSPGIIPGITQKWVRKEGETIHDFFGIPDSLIVIDSSGSMPNPDDSVSIPVLGASVISNSYLDNGAEVSVYNFSADNIVVGPSKNKQILHKTIRTYQSGGTIFNPNIVKNIIEKQGNIDISIVSDMDIHNLEDFLAYISSLPNVHRVHLFYTDSGNITGMAEQLRHKQNIGILPLHSQQDIKKIVMGELKKSIN